MRKLGPVLLGVSVLLFTACPSLSTGKSSSTTASGTQKVPGGCTAVDVASSPEKLDLLTTLAANFNKSKSAKVNGSCAFVRIQRVASGAGEQLLVNGWQSSDTALAQPVTLSPAARGGG